MTGRTRGGRAVFRLREFRYFVASRFLYGFALQMLNLALAWRVYDLTREPLALGMIGLFAFMPALLLSLVSGTVADHFDRRLILFNTYAVMAAGVFCFIFLSGAGRVWPAYALVFLLGCTRAFSNPASQALMPNLVPSEEFSAAAAWSNTSNQSATILGPGLGGLMYPLGVDVPFAVACGCLFVAIVLTFALKAPTSLAAARRPAVTLATLVAGYRFIWTSPAILGAITLDLVAVLLGGAVALLPVYAREVFNVGPWGLGLLRSSPAIGSIIAAVVLAHAPMSRRVGRVMFGAVIVYGLATILFAFATTLWAGMACLAVVGAADIVSVVVRQTLIQADTPDTMRGRVVSVHNILTSASNNLGDFESGALASWIGAPPAIVFGGVCAIGASFAWMRLFPGLRDRERMAG